MRGDGLLQRVMKANHQPSLVVSLASCVVHRDIFFYILFDDKRLHVYVVCFLFDIFENYRFDTQC